IWNASRLIITNMDKVKSGPVAEPQWTLADSWIWARLQELVRDVERLFQSYQYGEAGRQIYDFFWSEFADWYLEIAKLQLNEGGDRTYYTGYNLVCILDICLRLLHPFIPFVTEEIWGHLRHSLQGTPLSSVDANWPAALIIAPWPEPEAPEGWEKESISNFILIQDAIRSIRNIRAEKDVKPRRLIPAWLSAGDKTEVFRQQKGILAALAQLDPEKLTISSTLPPKQENDIVIAIGEVEIYLPLEGLMDIEKERARLTTLLLETNRQIERLDHLLSSSFAERAPAEIVQKEREKLSSYSATAETVKNQLEKLG
ncbi:MAG TPA: class I tRNA ligase family protein, partial [Anaerolineales bacterium]|nr:class I tRNA ligase family protein [Anaerolineales bacterium]